MFLKRFGWGPLGRGGYWGWRNPWWVCLWFKNWRLAAPVLWLRRLLPETIPHAKFGRSRPAPTDPKRMREIFDDEFFAKRGLGPRKKTARRPTSDLYGGDLYGRRDDD